MAEPEQIEPSKLLDVEYIKTIIFSCHLSQLR